MRAEWAMADKNASFILVDQTGEYQAFLMINGASVDSVGVRNVWRGKELAGKLYSLASRELASQGKTEMRAMVASINTASMRLHQKLGFTEYTQRLTVHERSW